MQKTCLQCSAPFEITAEDLAFYDKVSPVFSGKKEQIPAPTLCSTCREQRRLAFRNERSLHHRPCDKTGRMIISMYPKGTPFPVYDQAVWWSDTWDALEYGRTYDSSRPVLDQFRELLNTVPRISLINKQHDNSEYCNFAFQNKNSYLLFTSANCTDSYYCNRASGTTICDCSNVEKCERCYEVVDSIGCYHCRYLQNCSNCSDCAFGYGLKGCRNCFGCSHLSNAQYCIGNVQHSKESYEAEIGKLMRQLPETHRKFRAYLQAQPHRSAECIGCEQCSGNNLLNSQRARHCYEGMHLQDCSYVANATYLRDCYDIDNDDHSELMYEIVGSDSSYHNAFCDICWFNRELLYCSLCFHSSNLFGCVGMRHKQYCIFNKQYTKEEYEALVPQIITALQREGLWGEFFPAHISPFAYNETQAQYYFPRTRDAVLTQGWNWRDESESAEQYLGPAYTIPSEISQVSDDITKQILTCEVTGKPYKIIPQELKFYREMNIPIPRRCPDQRHKDRMALRNPRKLWSRQCAKCKASIETTYAPERPEIVYCEKCYLSTVY